MLVILNNLKKKNNGLSIEIDNSGNVESLLSDQIEVIINSTDFDLTKINQDGSNIIITDTEDNLIDFYLDYINISECRLFLKISQNALVKSIYILKLGTSSGSNYANVMKRRIVESCTYALYKCDSLSDSLGVGSNIINNNVQFVSSKFGAVAYFNGNSYFTIDEFKTHNQHYGFGFNFSLSSSQINKVVFEKIWNAGTNLVKLYFNGNGTLVAYVTINGITSRYLNTKYQNNNSIYSFYCYITKSCALLYLNGISVASVFSSTAILASPANPTPIIFGNSSDLTGGYFNGYIWDIEFDNLPMLEPSKQAYFRNTNVFNRTQNDKLTFVSQYPSTVTVGQTDFSESVFIIENDIIHRWYHRGFGPNGQIAYHYSSDFGATWSIEQIILGLGIGGESLQCYRTSIIKHNGVYYLIYLGVNSSGVQNAYLTMRESTDKVTFTNPQTVFDLTGHGGLPESSRFIFDTSDNLFKGIVQCGQTINGQLGWTTFYFQGASLTTMVSDYTQLQSISGVRSKNCSVAVDFKKVDNKYIVWSSQVPALAYNNVILPDIVFYAETETPHLDNWTTIEYPTIAIDRLNQNDQIADGCVLEYNGNTYFSFTGGLNQASGIFALFFYKANCTIKQFITDVKATIL